MAAVQFHVVLRSIAHLHAYAQTFKKHGLLELGDGFPELGQKPRPSTLLVSLSPSSTASEILDFATIHHLQLLQLGIVVPHLFKHQATFKCGSTSIAKELLRELAAGALKATSPAGQRILGSHLHARLLLRELLRALSA